MSDQYKIEDGIPIPGKFNNDTLHSVLTVLEIGQSVFVKDKKPQDISPKTSAAKRGTSKNFLSRTVDGGVRIWRIE